MQIKATYNLGRLEFSVPLKIARDEFPVVVDLPDEVIISEESVASQGKFGSPTNGTGSHLLAKFREIRGTMPRERPAASVQEDKESYSEALWEKHGK